jgi:V8-like Glu-specific endopeptidase
MAPVKFLVREMLEKARLSDRLVQLLAVVLGDPEKEAVHDRLSKLVIGQEARFVAAAIRRKPSLATLATLPPSMEVWSVSEKTAHPLAGFEKTVNAAAGFDDIAMFRKHLAQAEVRIARIDIGGKAKGTGFLVGEQLLLTNWHVVKKGVEGAVARFDCKVLPGGTTVDDGRVVEFATDWLVARSNHASIDLELGDKGPPKGTFDFALVRLKEPVGSQSIGPTPDTSGDVRGSYSLDGSAYKFEEAEPLLIVGHPEGRPMQLSYASPAQARLTAHDNRVRYHTNTEAGSSGSPVFNKFWRVVALHHAAGPTSVPGEFHLATKSFNQGIPVPLIVAEFRSALANRPELRELGLE